MIYGYVRVSTDEQTGAMQRDALKAAGCDRLFEDLGISGDVRPEKRPALRKLLAIMKPGDVVTVWNFDRLGRYALFTLQLAETFKQGGVQLRSLSQHIDTTTTGGEMVFQVFAAMAQMERSNIIERTKAGLKAARARGTKFGRKRKLTPQQVAHALQLMAANASPREVAKTYGVDKSTLYREIKRQEMERSA